MSFIAKYKPTKYIINNYIKNNKFHYKNNDFSHVIVRILYFKLLNLNDSQFIEAKNNINNIDKTICRRRIYNSTINFKKLKLILSFLKKFILIKINTKFSTVYLVFLNHDKYINYFKNSLISDINNENTIFLISDDIKMTNLIDKKKARFLDSKM